MADDNDVPDLNPRSAADELREKLAGANAELAEHNRKMLLSLQAPPPAPPAPLIQEHPVTERERLHVLVQRLWEHLPIIVEGEPGHDELVELAEEAARLGIRLVD